VFRLLQHALRLCEESGGAFDITIGPLMRCWGFMNDSGRVPASPDLEAARARVGWQSVDLDAASRTVRFAKDGMMLDLGAIGKGYAIDQAVEVLREAGITSGILHGGTSSIHAIGHPPEAEAWRIALRHPADALPESGGPAMPIVALRDEALSVSAVWGKSFQTDDRRFGHIIDPRTGNPAGDAVMAAVALASTTESDALSTALLTLGTEGTDLIRRLRPNARCLVARPESGGGLAVTTAGQFP
jgi:thiamine biosynthesis lipoprotein